MSMMTSQILKYVDFTKTEKSIYLENKTFLSSNKKKSLITHQVIAKNCFVAKVTFKGAFISYLLNNPLVSCTLINLHFLLSQIAQFDNNPFSAFATLGF